MKMKDELKWTFEVAEKVEIRNVDELSINLVKALDDINAGTEEFAILTPPEPIFGISFFQVCNDNSPGLYHVEAGLIQVDEKGLNVIVCKDGMSFDDVGVLFLLFYQNTFVDISGWYVLQYQ